MARLTLVRNKRTGSHHLVGVFTKTDNYNTDNTVIFIDGSGYIGYGTEEYLKQDYEPVSDEYKFVVKRETFKAK